MGSTIARYLMSLLAGSAILSVAGAATPDDCATVYESREVKVELCTSAAAHLAMVSVNAKSIAVYYEHGVSMDRPHFDKLWMVGRDHSMSMNDQAALRDVVASPSRALRESALLPTLSLLADFFPADQRVEPFDRIRGSARPQGITLICEFIGLEKAGYYTVDDEPLEQTVLIGREESGCYGRCGPACGSRNQYTQECLNHDVCNRITGQNWGVCEDEFWAAADGYMSAPDCR